MARSTKAAVLEETEVEETASEPTTKQVINDAIARVVEETGIDVQKNRYKAMRAIAYQAFSDRIDEGTFDQLVDDAIANADELPSGWGLERSVAEEKPAKSAGRSKANAKAPAARSGRAAVKAAPAKATAAKAAPRKRPAR